MTQVFRSCLGFSVVGLLMVGAPLYAHQSVDSGSLCLETISERPESLWNGTSIKDDPGHYSEIHFKRADYNTLLFFLNSMGGVTRLPTYFSESRPDVLVTVIPVRSNRRGLSEDSIAEFSPLVSKYFSFVVNLSSEAKYDELTTLDRLLEKTKELKAGTPERIPQRGFFRRTLERFQALDQKLMDTTHLIEPGARPLVEKRPLIEALGDLRLEKEKTFWSVIFVDEAAASDMESELKNIGFSQSIRVIDHLVVD